MDWSTRSLLTANFQTSNIRSQEQHQPQQFTAAGSKTNASIQNYYTYSGNNQTIKIHSNSMNTFANNWGFPNPGRSSTLQPILPKTSIHNKDVQPPHHVLIIPPNSLGNVSTEMVQVAAGMTQNSSLTKNVHISSPVIVQGNTENPMQNTPQQTVNQPIALNSYNNRPLQNSSNSMTTSVCQQNSKTNVSPKRLPMLMQYYHVNGPAASQIDATVPLNQASSQFSNSQQNLSCLVSPLHQYTQNQINCPSSSLTATSQSQHYPSDTVNPIQYGVPTPHNLKNATFPEDRNPPPYPVPSVQRNHGQFVLPQAVANISHENVQNYHSPMLAQSSNLYSTQHGERHASIPFIRETNEIGNTPYNVSGHKNVNQLPNELTKSSVEVGESLDVALTSQTGRTLEQEKNLANGSRHFPENLKNEITKESLALDQKNLQELKKTFVKLSQDYKRRCKMYLSSVQNSQAADSSVHNQNPVISLPSYNTNLNQSLPLPKDTNQTNQVLPHDAAQSLPPTSYNSGEVKDAPLSLNTNDHLLPILRNMLKGTTDELMLFKDCVEKGGTCHSAIRENSPSAPLLSTSDVCETTVNNTVNNINEASRLRSNTSTMDSTQVPLTCTKNGPGYEITTRPANNQSVSWNKSTVETTGQYFTDSVQSSNQNPAASNGSSLSKKEASECIKQFQNATSAYPRLIQHSNTSLPKLGKKTIAESSENTSNSFSSAPLPKATVQETGITQKPSVTGSSFVVPEVCWEAVKKSLALWTKSLPASLKQLGKKKDSAVSLPLSEDGVDGGEKQQTLEKLPNTLTQKDQNKVTVGSNETTMSSVPSSLGKRLDVINSNLLKGSELQVAIVTPLVMSKESNQNEVQKIHSSLLEVTYPIIEESGVRSLQELSSVVPAADEGGRGTVCSASNTGITIKKEDLDMHEKTTKPSEENLIVKAEMNKDCLIHEVPQKDVKCYKSNSVLLEPGHTAEVVLNDTVLEISSVCTLVQGDAFYNSQIADIFNSSPLKSSRKNDTSEEHMPLQHGEQQSSLLKSESEKNTSASEGDTVLPSQDCLPDATAEKLLEELSSLEIPQSGKASNEVNVRDSEEGKSNSMTQSTPLSGEKLEQATVCDRAHSADFGSDNEVLPVNKGSSNTADEAYTIAKESATENVPYEENKAHSEAPKIVLNDQLTELLEEFPYGISYPKTLKYPDNNNLVSKLSEKEDEEKPQSSVETPSQIKITILTSEQMKEMFPEQSQSSSNIKKNCEDDQHTTDFKDDLREENRSHSKIDQAVPYESRNTPAETTAAKPSKDKYCCLRGWLASTMAVEPCECILSEVAASKQVDLCPQSKTISKVKPEVAANHKPECMLNDELKISTLHPVSNCVSLEAQGNTILDKTFRHTKTCLQENESKVDSETVPLSFSEKLGSQELEVPVKQEVEELPPHIAPPTLKSETIEIKIKNRTCERDNFSADQAQCCSSTKDLKVVAARNLSKTETSVKQRSRERLVVRSKTDHRRRKKEMKHNTYHERYKIKRDSSETCIIKGPGLSKSLKRIEKKHKALVNQHNDTIKSPNISSIKMKNSPHISTMPSPEHLNVKKREKFDFEKNYGYKKTFGETKINSEPSRTEHIEHNEESIQRKNLKLNLQKYAYSKRERNAGNYSSHLDAPPKHTSHASNIIKIPSPVKEGVLEIHNRDKRLERSISDKKTCFNRRTGRLSISLQKEQKKKYLNQVAFRRIAQKTISLTNLDSHSKPVWHVKSSSVSALPEDEKTSSSPHQQPEVEKPQMLQFKMCPEILFRKSVSKEQILDGKNRPEKDKTPITAVKSKREDWLNYNPVKRRKTEECEAQVNDDIPLDAAIKLLEGMPVKDSKATFQTYKKMHLEKRSRSLDSTPLN